MTAPLSPAELAAAEALARHFNENYSDGIERHGAANWTPEARAVVAAVHQTIADETALQLGRDLLDDGLESFLHRLIGEKHALFVLNLVRAEAIEDAAAREFNAATPTDARLRLRLYSRAAEVRATPLPGSPLATANPLSTTTPEEHQR
jgi:hypothetical protein